MFWCSKSLLLFRSYAWYAHAYICACTCTSLAALCVGCLWCSETQVHEFWERGNVLWSTFEYFPWSSWFKCMQVCGVCPCVCVYAFQRLQRWIFLLSPFTSQQKVIIFAWLMMQTFSLLLPPPPSLLGPLQGWSCTLYSLMSWCSKKSWQLHKFYGL